MKFDIAEKLLTAGLYVFAMVTVAGTAMAASDFPDAAASDPNTLGLMQGSPPAPDKRVMQPDSNFFSFPKLRWSVCHIRELMPTKQVSRGLGAPVLLEYALDDGIDALTFMPTGSDKLMTWKEALAANYTDGMLVMHKGKVVYENYTGCLAEAGKHAAMSMTKSMTGLLAEILVAEGTLDDKALVSTIIPELAGSAFADATVRQVMDMTTGLAYSEDYANPKADIWVYSTAANPMPKPADYDGPVGYYEYLQTVKKEGKHGEAFGYKTINTDALGWIVSRVSGKSITGLLSERIWSRMGAEQDGYFTVDGIGTPFAGGGLSAGLRDLGRIGQLMLDKGEINGERLFPANVADKIRAGGDKAAFEKAGYNTLTGGSYRGMWWVFHNDHGAYAARGVHGQTIYIDPTAEMVIVRLSSHPVAKNAVIDPTSLPAYQAVAEYLMSED
jgi:CubicO group peptidase (beta-lactamase class C family)